ncbi:adenylylsulfate kinase [Acidothermus cellulolyticus 11B]|uniref:Adenylyl-sulfate kinase n=1 Tax=Acidothermus cellulolyticus (strain ATCC 43068 / DSM 8971 / 11B) TaxID=351607 RepID=A0LVD1_ACIC1|nr:adenylyl-sulfate kinase [Acidothermus cellulolyticus]ABK53391.1 adenylylsulfate kinase [Acidothermus cellulolyticus 11B]MCL6549398.1 adenylyl-sulfate kinase [Acidothermus cellulolyticus]
MIAASAHRLRAAPVGSAVLSRGGATVWFTGLPSAGKSTLASGLAARLQVEGRQVEILDGDELRRHLTADLGFSRQDRETNVRRVGFVARLLARHGVFALVPVIAPYQASRAAVRAEHAAEGIPFVEVHVATPLSVCAARDVKGLYAKQQAGVLRGLTGVDDPYEEPQNPELRLDTTGLTVAEAVDRVYAVLVQVMARSETPDLPITDQPRDTRVESDGLEPSAVGEGVQ